MQVATSKRINLFLEAVLGATNLSTARYVIAGIASSQLLVNVLSGWALLWVRIYHVLQNALEAILRWIIIPINQRHPF